MEANLTPGVLEYQVTFYSPPVQREGLTSARYRTQNFKSSEEPLVRTEKEIHIRVGSRAKASLGTASSLTQEAVCGASGNKRRGEGRGGRRTLHSTAH